MTVVNKSIYTVRQSCWPNCKCSTSAKKYWSDLKTEDVMAHYWNQTEQIAGDGVEARWERLQGADYDYRWHCHYGRKNSFPECTTDFVCTSAGLIPRISNSIWFSLRRFDFRGRSTVKPQKSDRLWVAIMTFQNSLAPWGCKFVPITNMLHSDNFFTQQLKDYGFKALYSH